MAYTHLGARLARLGRFDSCTLYQTLAPVVQRTRTVGLHPTDAGSTPERRTIEFAGLADAAMHSPFKRDEAGSIPASRTMFKYEGASFNRIRIEPSKLSHHAKS